MPIIIIVYLYAYLPLSPPYKRNLIIQSVAAWQARSTTTQKSN